MRTEHRLALGATVIATASAAALNYCSENFIQNSKFTDVNLSRELTQDYSNSGYQLVLNEWSDYSTLPPVLATKVPTPRALATLTPTPSRMQPTPRTTSITTGTPTPDVRKEYIPQVIPTEFDPKKYTPEPLGSKLNEPGTPLFEPWQIGGAVGAVVFLSGLGACVMVKETCKLMKNIIWKK